MSTNHNELSPPSTQEIEQAMDTVRHMIGNRQDRPLVTDALVPFPDPASFSIRPLSYPSNNEEQLQRVSDTLRDYIQKNLDDRANSNADQLYLSRLGSPVAEGTSDSIRHRAIAHLIDTIYPAELFGSKRGIVQTPLRRRTLRDSAMLASEVPAQVQGRPFPQFGPGGHPEIRQPSLRTGVFSTRLTDEQLCQRLRVTTPPIPTPQSLLDMFLTRTPDVTPTPPEPVLDPVIVERHRQVYEVAGASFEADLDQGLTVRVAMANYDRYCTLNDAPIIPTNLDAARKLLWCQRDPAGVKSSMLPFSVDMNRLLDSCRFARNPDVDNSVIDSPGVRLTSGGVGKQYFAPPAEIDQYKRDCAAAIAMRAAKIGKCVAAAKRPNTLEVGDRVRTRTMTGNNPIRTVVAIDGTQCHTIRHDDYGELVTAILPHAILQRLV